MSIFLGYQLADVIQQLRGWPGVQLIAGRQPRARRLVTAGPAGDATDRNRTSPFPSPETSSSSARWVRRRRSIGRRRCSTPRSPIRLRSSPMSSTSSSRAISTACRSSCRRLPARTSRFSSRAMATRRSGTPRQPREACPTTRRPLTHCPPCQRQRQRQSSPSTACCPSASLRRASASPGSATSRSAASRASAALDIARTMIMPAAVRYLGQLLAAGQASSAVEALCARIGKLVNRAQPGDGGSRTRRARGA